MTEETVMVETLDTEAATRDGLGEDDPKPDAAPRSGSGSDSDSDCDCDSDSDESENLKVQALERDLDQNPSNYDSHVQYIRCLRKLGQIEKLRKARESMNALFPLCPKMWQEWAKDEASLSIGPESFDAILKLYEQGVKEYVSVSLWCDYIDFLQKHDQSVSQCSPAGISKMRDLFERALSAGGLHVVEGGKIWEAYREFEQAILVTIDGADSEEKTKHIQHIRGLFRRQLSVPLTDLSSLLQAYKLWEAEQGTDVDVNSDDLRGLPAHVTSAYQKAIKMFNERVQFEEQLSHSDLSETERLQRYMNYIKFEESSGDPARVQILYERAVADLPVASDLWLSYTSYLDRTLKVANVAKNVYSRATRNCPWVVELWVRYLLCLERAHASEKDISSVFENSLQCGFSSYESYLELFLTRVDGLRRRISLTSEVEDGLNHAFIRDIFQYASEYLVPHLKNTDGLLRLHAYWAHLELNLGKDLVAARGVWESLIKTSGAMLDVWRSYIAMEIETGHIKEARSIYKRCYSKRFLGTGSEDICYSWLRFEREFGTLEDFDHAERKVTPRLEELQLYKLQEDQRTKTVSVVPSENFPAKTFSHKRKSGTRVTESRPPSKKQKDISQRNNENGNDTVENDTSNKSKEAIGGEPLNVSSVSTSVDTMNEVEDAPEEGKPMYMDECTAFVSNLHLKANEEHIRQFFSDIGGVTAIRLLKDWSSGRSRGLAYVDFSDEAHLEAAVSKNRQNLLGMKLSIARSDPSKGHKRKSSESNTVRGRGRGAFSGGGRGKAAVPKKSVEGSEAVTRNAPLSISHIRGGHVQLTGRNTFAMPRNVARSCVGSGNEVKNEGSDDKPKSNDEFRKMFLQS